MALTFEQAVNIVNVRRGNQSALLNAMIAVRDRYNGDYAIPLPTSDRARPRLTPALLADGIDMPAMVASSTNPQFFFPAVNPAVEEGRRSKEYAAKRRRACAATWHESKWALMRRRAFRQIGGYGRAAILVIADDHEYLPRIVLRDPITSYPEPKAPEDVSPPLNAGFVFARTAHSLVVQYGEGVLRTNGGIIPTDAVGWEGELWDCLEWIDPDQCLIGIIGPQHAGNWDNAMRGDFNPQLLRRYPNRLGYAPCVVPQVITLDKIVSRLMFMTGKVDAITYLLDLDIAATEKSVFPDRYVIGNPNETPKLVSNQGRWADGRTGQVNLIAGARAVGELRGTPDPNNKVTITQLERLAKMDAGTTSVQGGEGMGAFRTGKAIDSLLAASFDPRVQELQEIMQVSMAELNRCLLDMYAAYWPERKYTLFSGWSGDLGEVDFTPRIHFEESQHNVVTYPLAGMDKGAMTVEVAELVGAEMISRETGRRMHPDIDAEDEESKIFVETARRGLIEGLLQRMQSGQLPPADLAVVIQSLQKHPYAPEEGVIEAQRIIEERQATPAPETAPGLPPAPEAQPGLALPGEGAEQMPPGGAPGGAGLDVAGLLGALTAPPQPAGVQGAAPMGVPA